MIRQRLVNHKIYALPVQGYVGSLAAPSEATLTQDNPTARSNAIQLCLVVHRWCTQQCQLMIV